MTRLLLAVSAHSQRVDAEATLQVEAADDVEERRLSDALMRPGRLTALERVSHLKLELHDRLAAVGLAREGRFPLPATQEVLARPSRTERRAREPDPARAAPPRSARARTRRGHLPDRAASTEIDMQAVSG